jgi:hypothetical protein
MATLHLADITSAISLQGGRTRHSPPVGFRIRHDRLFLLSPFPHFTPWPPHHTALSLPHDGYPANVDRALEAVDACCEYVTADDGRTSRYASGPRSSGRRRERRRETTAQHHARQRSKPQHGECTTKSSPITEPSRPLPPHPNHIR